MNCDEVQPWLSGYFDGELPADLRPAVAEHVDQCGPCAAQLATFQRLSGMAQDLRQPEPPDMWAALERQLDAESGEPRAAAPFRQPAMPSSAASARVGRSSSIGLHRILQIAALLLVAAGVGTVAVSLWQGSGHHHPTTGSLGEYIDAFGRDPDAAQAVLAAHYPVRPIDPATGLNELAYRPAVADLPAEYTLHAAYLVEMPCCRCLQAVCQRRDGSVLTVFEHEKKEAVGLGQCTCTDMQCGDKAMCMASKGSRLAAARWEHNGHYLTVVGVRDADEAVKLMAHLNSAAAGDS